MHGDIHNIMAYLLQIKRDGAEIDRCSSKGANQEEATELSSYLVLTEQ